MPRWMRITGIVLLLLLIVAGGAYYWYIGDGNAPSDAPPYGFDIAAVRAKVSSLTRDFPVYR